MGRTCFLFESGDSEVLEGPGSWLTVRGKQSLVSLGPRANLQIQPCLRRVCRWPRLHKGLLLLSLLPPSHPFLPLALPWLSSACPTVRTRASLSDSPAGLLWRQVGRPSWRAISQSYCIPPTRFPSPTLAWRRNRQDCTSLSSFPRPLSSSGLPNLDLCPSHSLAGQFPPLCLHILCSLKLAQNFAFFWKIPLSYPSSPVTLLPIVSLALDYHFILLSHLISFVSLENELFCII